MNKTNGSAIRKVSAKNPATTHTRDRCNALRKMKQNYLKIEIQYGKME